MSWVEARDPAMYRPIAIALLMRFLQQLTGITPILVYLQPVFTSTAVLLVRAPPPALLQAPSGPQGPSITWHPLCATYLAHVQGATSRGSYLCPMPCTCAQSNVCK